MEISEICEKTFDEVLPDEIKDIIFNYLSVADLLNLCGMSKRLNEFIGSSHICMAKIWIKFYTFKLKDLESLTFSIRNYEKLKVNRVKRNDHFEYLTDLQHEWRKVLVYNCEFKDIQLLMNLIKSFSESIEELEISDIQVLSNDREICGLKFPKLKRVLFRNVPTSAIESFLGQNQSLENASFDIVQEIEGRLPLAELIQRFLKNNDKLTHLQLGPHFIKSLFDQEGLTSDFGFELKRLLLMFPLIRDASPHIQTNVSNFLLDQQKIDWILFFELSSEEILQTAWNRVASVTRLTFIGLEELFDDSMNVELLPNLNITHLDLLCRRILISQLRKLFVAAPNLKVLHVHTLTKYIMDFTAKNHQKLQELHCKNIDEEVQEIYNELKASTDGVNTQILLKKVSFWQEKTNPFLYGPKFWHT